MKPQRPLRPLASLLAALAITLTLAPATLDAADDSGLDWRFPVGLAYASGIPNVLDAIESQNFDLESEFIIPVGLVFSPYVEFDFGLGVGVTVGPPSFVLIDVDYYDGYDSWGSDYASYIVPIGADLRYTLLRQGNVSPYVRAGIRYPLVGGDFLKSADPGFYGGVGIEFLRQKRIAFGVEVGYDTTEIEVESETFPSRPNESVKSAEVMVSIFAVF